MITRFYCRNWNTDDWYWTAFAFDGTFIKDYFLMEDQLKKLVSSEKNACISIQSVCICVQ